MNLGRYKDSEGRKRFVGVKSNLKKAQPLQLQSGQYITWLNRCLLGFRSIISDWAAKDISGWNGLQIGATVSWVEEWKSNTMWPSKQVCFEPWLEWPGKIWKLPHVRLVHGCKATRMLLLHVRPLWTSNSWHVGQNYGGVPQRVETCCFLADLADSPKNKMCW